MSGQHTPAPWFVFSTGHCIGGPKPDRDPPTAGIAMFSMGARTQEENLANAAHAVKCVNAHDDLVAALKAANEFIEGFHGDEAQENIPELMAQICAAIAKAAGSDT